MDRMESFQRQVLEVLLALADSLDFDSPFEEGQYFSADHCDEINTAIKKANSLIREIKELLS